MVPRETFLVTLIFQDALHIYISLRRLVRRRFRRIRIDSRHRFYANLLLQFSSKSRIVPSWNRRAVGQRKLANVADIVPQAISARLSDCLNAKFTHDSLAFVSHLPVVCNRCSFVISDILAGFFGRNRIRGSGHTVTRVRH